MHDRLKSKCKNNYKGFIYCRSIQEAQSVKKFLMQLLKTQYQVIFHQTSKEDVQNLIIITMVMRMFLKN